jgi:hypothetical protein
MSKEEMKKKVKMKKARSDILLRARVYLIQAGGILGILLGLPLSTVGAGEVVRGAGMMVFDFSPLFVLNVGHVVGEVFLIVGMVVLVGGIALCYVGFELQRLGITCMILGSGGLIIPSMILGMGYNLAAGIVAIVVGFSWLFILLLWLKGG